MDGSPVSRDTFIHKLSMAIKYCDLDPSRYKGHSFRIGAASYAADAGMSDSQIRGFGALEVQCIPEIYQNPFLTFIVG